jgi:hypothetical protein
MNAVEIEAAVSELAAQPFDAGEFPFQFLTAFGSKETTLKRLRKGDSNTSDVPGGVLQRGNIHLATCARGETAATLQRLRESARTTAAKAKFIFATDGVYFEAEDLASGVPIADDLAKLADHFGYFLQLAGISTVREIKDNPIDVRATGRLNKLYVELLRLNPEWGSAARRHEMNHFMARLIFCYFAEHTDIFNGSRLFTDTVEQMSEADGSNTHQVIAEMFRAMNVKIDERASRAVPPYANQFPYVNGGLFSVPDDGAIEVPVFSRIARSYLVQAGKLEWDKINPDIFGSMIQAVADDEERDELGMHYTSVPNILKVLNPLFLDDLRAQLETAGDNGRMLLNLRRRLSRIRVFDPACGSGNFLVIAYKQMRSIEAKINDLRGEPMRKSDISTRNFRGIELRDFAAEIARLALVIAEYQCDVAHRGPLAAKAEFLPLDKMNWIVRGNALRLDWLEVCPPDGIGVRLHSDDLFQTPLDQVAMDFENDGRETFICGNPPFKGARKQTPAQKNDLGRVFGGGNAYKDCDYVTAWFLKASEYSNKCPADFAFVATNSISRGEQVEHLWSRLYEKRESIFFGYTQFKWKNNAAKNAGVWCVVIGISKRSHKYRFLLDASEKREVASISPYLIAGSESFIKQSATPISPQLPKLVSGNMARDDGGLILSSEERQALISKFPLSADFIRPLIGTTEVRRGSRRWCLWIDEARLKVALKIPSIEQRIGKVRAFRSASKAKTTQQYAKIAHRFAQRCHQDRHSIVVPKNTVEGIGYITPIMADRYTITSDLAFVCYSPEDWLLALLSSTLHRVWAEAISGGLGSGVRYSSHITYNTFPVPTLTDQNKADLTRCAENILIAREAHFPKTIADLYDPEDMPANLREAHEQNDETLERIYIGRRFRNDTERLEKLFAMYTEMQGREPAPSPQSAPNKLNVS